MSSYGESDREQIIKHREREDGDFRATAERIDFEQGPDAANALAQADFILLSMPAVAETRNFINDDTLAAMKKTAIIVNVARGDLIDEAALARACAAGTIGGAGSDVTLAEPTPADSPLWDAPNIILTPHIAGTGSNNTKRLLDIISENIDNYLAGRPLNRVLDWENMMPE